MEQAQLDSALARASALMNNEQFNALVESKASHGRKKKGGSSDLASFEAQAGFGGSQSRSVIQEQVAMPKQVQNNSKIPQAILESFSKTPAMSGGMDAMLTPPPSYFQEKKQIMTEQYAQPQQQPQYQQPQIQGAIDYNYLKYIINECIKENMNNMLNESTSPSLRGFKMCSGNKIQFVDSKGNLYEGTLTLKKKATK